MNRNGRHQGRYVLVPRADAVPRPPGGPLVRRYSLARVAPSTRSALGVDRHARLERIAEADGSS